MCLDGNYHYDWPVKYTIEDMIGTFWATSFGNVLGGFGYNVFGGLYNNWKKMDFVQVEQEIIKLQNINLADFVDYRRAV